MKYNKYYILYNVLLWCGARRARSKGIPYLVPSRPVHVLGPTNHSF